MRRHEMQMVPWLRRLGRDLGLLGCGTVVGALVVRPSWTVPHLVAAGTVLVALIVLMAVVHFVHELVATLDGVRYEMGQRRVRTSPSHRTPD